jgi:hypothetical protein
MARPTGEPKSEALRLDFDRRLMLHSMSSQPSSFDASGGHSRISLA